MRRRNNPIILHMLGMPEWKLFFCFFLKKNNSIILHITHSRHARMEDVFLSSSVFYSLQCLSIVLSIGFINNVQCVLSLFPVCEIVPLLNCECITRSPALVIRTLAHFGL